SKSISGGILYDWGVHLLEYTLQIVDSEIVEVTGLAKTGVWATQTAWKRDTNEDEGFLLIRYANGTWSSLCISQIDCHPKHGWLEITGTKGSYIFEHESWELITRDRQGSEVTVRGTNQPSQWHRYYRNIADHLTKDTPLVITPQWARRPIHILDLAGQSVTKGRSLRAKYS
ncbi:MAG: Gfo/Idh/MocA family protein, partial [Alphaproteobacteria bacterium]